MTKTPAPFMPTVRRRLRRVRDFILAHPRQFGMELIAARSRRAMKAYEPDDDAVPNLTLSADCGTTCCIAGWYQAATPKPQRMGWPTDTMRRDLGSDFWLARSVYHANEWPDPFAGQFSVAKTAKAEARIAAARIDYLLETGR